MTQSGTATTTFVYADAPPAIGTEVGTVARRLARSAAAEQVRLSSVVRLTVGTMR